MKALSQTSLEDTVFSHISFERNVFHPKYLDHQYMILKGGKKNQYILLISCKNERIIKKCFQLIKIRGQFLFKNGGQILFDSLDEIISYMIERYAL